MRTRLESVLAPALIAAISAWLIACVGPTDRPAGPAVELQQGRLLGVRRGDINSLCCAADRGRPMETAISSVQLDRRAQCRRLRPKLHTARRAHK